MAGVLERGYEVGASRGKLLAAVVVLSCRSGSLSLTGPCRGAWGAAASFLGTPWLAFPASASCRGLGTLLIAFPASSSCRGLVFFPASSSCRGLVLSTLFLNGLRGNHGGSWRSPGKPCRGMLRLPVHKFGVLGYPYSSAPTIPFIRTLFTESDLTNVGQTDTRQPPYASSACQSVEPVSRKRTCKVGPGRFIPQCCRIKIRLVTVCKLNKSSPTTALCSTRA